MANKKDEDVDKALTATAAARPTGSGLNRGQTVLPNEPSTESYTGDPFIEDMMDVANEPELDGNAQINSPQAEHDDEGSPGTSR
jgi:hypothetical protein